MRRIFIARELSSLIQFDVIDGVFARPGNFNDPEIVKNNIATEKVDVHLMVMDIETELKRWMQIRPYRINLHAEHPGDLNKYFDLLEKNKIQKGLVAAPFTPIEKIVGYFHQVDYLLIMSVNPGRNGQPFIPDTFERIRAIRGKYPHLLIGVDGGIKMEHLVGLKSAGANCIVTGSSLFNGKEKENYSRFIETVK